MTSTPTIWRTYVREHLPPLACEPTREAAIVDELVAQLQDIYDGPCAAVRRLRAPMPARVPRCATGRRWRTTSCTPGVRLAPAREFAAACAGPAGCRSHCCRRRAARHPTRDAGTSQRAAVHGDYAADACARDWRDDRGLHARAHSAALATCLSDTKPARLHPAGRARDRAPVPDGGRQRPVVPAVAGVVPRKLRRHRGLRLRRGDAHRSRRAERTRRRTRIAVAVRPARREAEARSSVHRRRGRAWSGHRRRRRSAGASHAAAAVAGRAAARRCADGHGHGAHARSRQRARARGFLCPYGDELLAGRNGGERRHAPCRVANPASTCAATSRLKLAAQARPCLPASACRGRHT